MSEAVAIGRLNKKIAKLTKQRDFYRLRCDYYAKVMEMHTYMERTYKSVQEARNERDRVRGLEERVKEQAMLIKQLSAATPQEEQGR